MNVALPFIFNCPLIAYFLKKNYSLRQNILKILRVWERSLTSVSIGVYLDLIEVGTWLETGSMKDFEDLLEKEWPDAAPNSEVQHPVDSREVQNPWNCDWIRPVNPDRTQPESGASSLLRLRSTGRWIAFWPDAGRTLFQRSVTPSQQQFTSCELAGRWTSESDAASGHSFSVNLQSSFVLSVPNQVPTSIRP